MIITQDKVTVESNIVTTDRKVMSLKVGPEIFAILTKNLYANPALAALSEAGQNAYDSHKRAGRADEAFNVQLPSYFDPRLVIRDYGIGMTHDFILNDYCVAGQSSKSNDAAQSGGFGIGRLSGLALSTTYNISCYNGESKRTYSVFINGDGMPEVNHVATVGSLERSGVEITIPINSKDLGAFPHAAQEAFRFYNPKPIIKGVSHFTFEQNRRTLQGNKWEIDESISSPVAVGGVYHYPIEPGNISGLTETQSDLLNSSLGLVLYFEPSEIAPQANRQGLFYNEATCNAIRTRLNTIEAEIKDVVQAQFDKCANILEAKHLWHSYFQSGGAAYKLGKAFGTKQTVHWQGHVIDDGYFTVLEPDPLVPSQLRTIPGVSLRVYQLVNGRRVTKVEESKSAFNLVCRPGNRIFLNDLEGGRGAKRRVGYALKTTAGGNTNVQYYSVHFKSVQAKNVFHAINYTDDSIFESTNALVVPVGADSRGLGTDSVKHKLKVFKFTYASGKTKSDCWTPTEIDEDEGGVFTTVFRFEPRGMSNRELRYKLSLLQKHGAVSKDVTIYGIKVTEAFGKAQPAILATLKASEDWIELGEWIKEEREKLLPAAGLGQAFVDASTNENMKHFNGGVAARFNNTLISDYDSKAKFIQAQGKSAEQYEELADAYKELGGALSATDVQTYDMDKEWNAILAAYPMLGHLYSDPSYWSEANVNIAIEYVETVDLANEMRATRKNAMVA